MLTIVLHWAVNVSAGSPSPTLSLQCTCFPGEALMRVIRCTLLARLNIPEQCKLCVVNRAAEATNSFSGCSVQHMQVRQRADSTHFLPEHVGMPLAFTYVAAMKLIGFPKQFLTMMFDTDLVAALAPLLHMHAVL